MLKIYLFIISLMITCTIFTYGQANNSNYNLDWSVSHSLSGGVFKSAPKQITVDATTVAGTITTSNEYIGPTGELTQGVVRKFDNNGNLIWSTGPIGEAIDPVAFPGGGIVKGLLRLREIPLGEWGQIYNSNPTTSHLFLINSIGETEQIQLTGINNITDSEVDLLGNIYVAGRSPESDCGGLPCNGMVVAKYNSDGINQWSMVSFPTNTRIRPTDLTIDHAGNVIVLGKKATLLTDNEYDIIFVLKYSPNGTLLWQRELNAGTTEDSKLIIQHDSQNAIYIASSEGNSVKLRKLAGINGTSLWIKNMNNTGLITLGLFPGDLPNDLFPGDLPGDILYLSTTTGMRAFNSNGTLLWTNNLCGQWIGLEYLTNGELLTIATNVSQAEPNSKFLIKLKVATGEVLLQKNLSFGSHEEYLGEFEGMTITSQGFTHIYFLNNDDTLYNSYGTRLTKIKPCSEFDYNFSSSASSDINYIGANDNWSLTINVNWSGTFNSWPHIELWKGNVNIKTSDTLGTDAITIDNLPLGNYTVKVFDESCGMQEHQITAKCPPPSGLSSTNITHNKARLNWTLEQGYDSYTLLYRLLGEPTWTTVNTKASYKQLNNLIPNAVYEWQLSAKCGTVKPAVFSDYSPIQTFVTLPPRQMFIADTEENDSEENPEDISEVSSNTDSPEISQITDKKESFSKNDNIDELNKNFQTDSEQLAVEYDAFKLKQNYPNPFFDGTVIEYELEVLSDVTLRIYDGAGRLVENALQGQFNQGIYKYTFYSHDNSSGFYVAVLSCNGFSKTMNMRLIK